MSASTKWRIKRAHEKILKEREREKARNKPLTEETDVVDFFEKRLGFKATAYQERFLRDKSHFLLAIWSRQSGRSLAIAVAVLFNVLTRPNFRVAVIAPSLRQARKMIAKISRLVSRLGLDVLDGSPRKGRLEFRNESVIEALPNNPDTIRGETLN